MEFDDMGDRGQRAKTGNSGKLHDSIIVKTFLIYSFVSHIDYGEYRILEYIIAHPKIALHGTGKHNVIMCDLCFRISGVM